MSFSKNELENMSLDARKSMGASSVNEPVDPLKIQLEGVKVVTLSQIEGLSKPILKHLLGDGSSEWSAMSVPLDADFDNWVIVRNDSHDVERQRVSLLEEFWHILLGHSLVRIVKMGNSHGRTYHPLEEEEAYYLASATLLPREAIINFVKKKKKDLSEFAKLYGVSSDLVEYRIKRLGQWYNYKPKKITVLK